MDIIRTTDIKRMSSGNQYDLTPFRETKTKIDSGDGYMLELEEMKLGNVYVGQAKYVTQDSRLIRVTALEDCIISHFAFSGKSLTIAENQEVEMDDNQFSLFYKNGEQTHLLSPTGKGYGHFFQVTFPRTALPMLFVKDSRFLNDFCERIENGRTSQWAGINLFITPDIRKLIYEMSNAPYKGDLKILFLEAKLMELFVIQINAFDKADYRLTTRLKRGDKERICAVKEFLDNNMEATFTLVELAHRVGINQTKLKSGFKQLFGTTVFSYLTDLRMEKARQLIVNENMYIGEVADRVGYQHPHHFAAAFKRKFGYCPSMLKC
jgi:AraC-like DNA-binding protein